MRRDGGDSTSLTGHHAEALTPDVRPRHVYVHVPFCARRCTYCDFAIAVRRHVPVESYVDAVARELEIRHPVGWTTWPVETLYLGGGTPSALGREGVHRLLDVLTRRFALGPGAEVTLEANPEDVTDAASVAWRGAGVNRVSLGVQSFHPDTLAWMHRSHTPQGVVDAVRALRGAGIASISLDLIFAVPASLGRDWASDLDRLLALDPEHVSLYGLTVEPGTALARWIERGRAVEATEEAYEAEFLLAHERLTDAGYDHYEVSNFGRPGHHACHNRAYWTGAPYLGLGPAAHGFDGSCRRWNRAGYHEWQESVSSGRDPLEGAERLDAANRIAEQVYLELRTADGTVLNNGEISVVGPWVEAGWARVTGSRVMLTVGGWLRLDSLAVALANVRTR